MDHVAKRRMPPVWVFIVVFVSLYSSLSVGLTWVLGLPWRIPISLAWGLVLGVPLLILGGGLMIWAFRSLGVRRIFGKELFLDKSQSTLIQNGIYAYTRNPLYVSGIVLLLGWFFVLRLTPFAFLTALFLVHFVLVAKWEEWELRQRFGQEYEEYRKRVPLFIPRLRGGKRDDSPNKVDV